ncbi:MAG: PAS domain-containing protein, partial [Rhodospirillaceae bacterium]|nr:PAS domain-containing protein [Rhodospirillaceae bacterium]
MRVPASNLLATTALAAAPTVLAFAILVLTGALAPAPALLAALGAGLALALIIRLHLRNLLSSLTYVERLARTGEAAPAAPGEERSASATATGLGPAVARVRRAWGQRGEELGRVLEQRELVLDSLPNPLLLLDGESTVVEANRQARELFGPDLTGRSVESVLRDPGFLAAVQTARDTETSRDAEFVLAGRVA